MSVVGVTGVTAGEGSEERIGSLSGLSRETSSVASRYKINKLVKNTGNKPPIVYIAVKELWEIIYTTHKYQNEVF